MFRGSLLILLFTAPVVELWFIQAEFTRCSINTDAFRKLQSFIAKFRRMLFTVFLLVDTVFVMWVTSDWEFAHIAACPLLLGKIMFSDSCGRSQLYSDNYFSVIFRTSFSVLNRLKSSISVRYVLLKRSMKAFCIGLPCGMNSKFYCVYLCPFSQRQRAKFRTIIHAQHYRMNAVCRDPVK